MAKRILGPRGSQRRRTRSLIFLGVIAAIFAVFFVAGASGILTDSTFESADGNLAVDISGNHDWNSPAEPINCTASPTVNCGIDRVNDKLDDALGQGSKEDDTAPTIVDGSIPPSKDDLTRFYVNHEKRNGSDFLYLAWERSNLLGSAHLDFELNQNSVGFTSSSTGVVTLNRTAGDRLIDFDFGGSGVPNLAVRTWLTQNSNPTGNPQADCEAATAYPCWGKGKTLGSSAAEAQVNSSNVTDTNQPNAPFTVVGNTKNGINSTFGEMGINLQGAGIFNSGNCIAFSDAWLKSRSSGNSFTSELKDIVAPIPINLSNCGELKIIKRTSPRGVDKDFTFQTSDIPSTATVTHTIDANGQFTLNDKGNTTADSDGNTQVITNLLSGTYHVKEISPGTGWDLTGLGCTQDGTAVGNVDSNDPSQLVIPVSTDKTTICTFTNTKRGKIIVKKTTTPAGGTGFTFSGDVSGTIGDQGTISTDNLVPGTYTSTEAAKSGWDLTSISCDDGQSTTASSGSVSTRTATFKLDPGETVTCTFANTQRGTIVIKKRTSPRGIDQAFTFHNVDIPTGTGGASFSHSLDTSGNFALNDVGNTGTGDSTGNTQTITNVVPGTTYHIQEVGSYTGFVLDSISCDNNGGANATDASKADIPVVAGTTTTCTFTNRQLLGALKIVKQSIKTGNAKLAGAKFSVTGPGNYSATDVTTGSDGTVCIGGLTTGSYTVTETTAPTGYAKDPTPQTLTVAPSGATCTSFTGGTTFTFNDTPLTDLLFKVTSEDTGNGGTSSSMTCTKDVATGTPPAIGTTPQPVTGGPANPVQITASGTTALVPGDYTCKVHIDP